MRGTALIENRRAAPLRMELEGGSRRSSDAGSCEGVRRYTVDFRRGNRAGIRRLAGLYARGGFAGKLGTLAGKDADGGFAGKLGTLGGKDAVGGFVADGSFAGKLGTVDGNAGV